MIQISLPYIYSLSATLQKLNTVAVGKALKDVMWILMGAEQEMTDFLTQSVYGHAIRAYASPGRDLIAAIKKLTTSTDTDRALDWYDVYSVTKALEKFETVFTAEMDVGAAYLVTKKRGYDTNDLIYRAEILFPPELPLKVPESIPELREAGKCIAFEMGSAAGFHIMRATELVVRRYYDVVMNGAHRPTNNNLGGYLKEMEDKGVADAKVICAMRQITSLHRNPLMHPEEILTLDEAIALMGIAQSAVIAMLGVIPDPPPPALVLTPGT